MFPRRMFTSGYATLHQGDGDGGGAPVVTTNTLPLLHSPATILRKLLVDFAQGVEPGSSPWPVFSSNEPDLPDNCVTTFDTVGRGDGRAMNDGKAFSHYGVQVRVRAVTHPVGYLKIAAIREVLAQDVYDETVTVDDTVYQVHNLSAIGQVMVLGKELPTSRRSVFTLNVLIDVKRADVT